MFVLRYIELFILLFTIHSSEGCEVRNVTCGMLWQHGIQIC